MTGPEGLERRSLWPPSPANLWLAIGLVLGTGIRLWLIGRTPGQWYAVDHLFDRLGWHLAQGRGFTLDGTTPAAHVGPLYPALLSLWYSLLGHRPEWVPYLHAGLDLLTSLFLFLAARRVFGQATATLAALLFYFYPAYWTYDLRLRSEIVLTLLLTAWLWAALRCVHQDSRPAYALSGLLGGMAILCKPVLIPVALLLGALPAVYDRGSPGRSVPALAVYLGCLVLVVAPWTVRNLYAFGKPIPVSTGVGVGLWMGSDPVSRGSWPMPAATEIRIWDSAGITPLAYPHAMYEVAVDQTLFDKGVERILADPLRYLALIGGRAVDLWIGNGYYLSNAEPTLWLGLQADMAERGMLVAGYSFAKRLVLFPGMLVLAAWACWAHRANWRTLLPLYLFPIGLTLAYVPFTVEAGRYVLPVLPCLFILAAWSLVQGWKRLETAVR